MREVPLSCLPDYAQIDFKIAVSQHVTCTVGSLQGKVRVFGGKLREVFLDVASGFPDDFQVSNDRILFFFIFQKRPEVYISKISLDSADGLLDMLQIVSSLSASASRLLISLVPL